MRLKIKTNPNNEIRNSKFGLRNFKLRRSRGGFALIFAIFLTLGIEAIAAGGLLQMMQANREIQRRADGVRLDASAQAVIDRGLRLVKEYVIAKNAYPNTTENGVVLGDNFNLTQGQTFSQWLSSWYTDTFRQEFANDVQTGVNRITISPSDIVIRETERDQLDSFRRYWVEVTAHSNYSSARRTSGQQIWLQLGQLFNFSIFSNEELEITPGPSATFQGPIFSNKSVYLFTDQYHTLSFTRSKDFLSSENPEPYVLESAGSIYYYFRSVVGKNYLMANNEYRLATPAEFRDPLDPDLTPAQKTRARAYQGQELDSWIGYAGWAGPWPYIPPKFYFLTNGLSMSGTGSNYKIQAQDKNGNYVNLTHADLTNATQFPYWWEYIMMADKYPIAGKMSYSTAYDIAHPPLMTDNWTPANPEMTRPPVNPAWVLKPVNTVADISHGVTERKIPIGDEDHPSGPHALIEPLTSIIPQNTVGTTATIADSDNVAKQKFQYQAGINIYMKAGANKSGGSTGAVTPEQSPDLAAGIAEGWIDITKTIYDYRVGTTLKIIQIDLGALMAARPDIANAEHGLMIYVHGYPPGKGYAGSSGPHGVKLVNARRVPKSGLTVVTNAVLFVQGNFNDYSYTASEECDPPNDNAARPQCYGNQTDANKALWDNEQWHVPPAFLAADRPVVLLSDQWGGAYGRDGQSSVSSVGARAVSTDYMLNAAVAAGVLPSSLTQNYPGCISNLAPCELTPGGNLGFSCPDNSYVNGKDGVTASCQYYRDPVTKIYYINRNSTAFQQSLTDGIPNTASTTEIPIFVNELSLQGYNSETGNYNILEGIRGIVGNGFRSISAGEGLYDRGKAAVAGTTTTNTTTTCTCSSYQTVACAVPGGACALGKTCNGSSGEGSASCSACPSSATCNGTTCNVLSACCAAQSCSSSTTTTTTGGSAAVPGHPRIYYSGPTYWNYLLYTTHYSGGLENFINLQESWGGNTLRYSGAMAVPWASKWMITTAGAPAYYGTSYYTAPNRIYDYNEDFRTGQPPGTPGVFSLKRERIRS